MEALERQWQDEPPVHLLVAAFVGFKKKAKGKPEDLLKMFPGGMIRG